MRLDKFLGSMGCGSRKDIKKACKAGLVTVNGKPEKKSSVHVDEYKDQVIFEGEKIKYIKYIYIMMNKPAGVVSATVDSYDRTVTDLLPDKYKKYKPFPMGRLDKDTEGLLILTNDGQLSHRMLSPENGVKKLYYAELERDITCEDIEIFAEGPDLGDFKAKESLLEKAGDKAAFVTISEGKFHQVKRMFEKTGNSVLYLKRLKMGEIKLDDSLALGEFRELLVEEVESMQKL